MTDGQKKYELAYRAKLEALRVRDFARVQQEEEYMRKIRSSYGISYEETRRIQREVEENKTMLSNPTRSSKTRRRSAKKKHVRKVPPFGYTALLNMDNSFTLKCAGRCEDPKGFYALLMSDSSAARTDRMVYGATPREAVAKLEQMHGRRLQPWNFIDEGLIKHDGFHESFWSYRANPRGNPEGGAVPTNGSGAGLLAVGALALIGGVIYVATRPDKPSSSATGGGGELPPPTTAPPSKSKCLNCAPSPTGDMTEAESFTKDTGYNVWCVEKQAVATWQPPKPEYALDPKARAYSQLDCSFYTWSAGTWVKDEIMNTELQTWRSKFVGTSGHPVSAFMPGV